MRGGLRRNPWDAGDSVVTKRRFLGACLLALTLARPAVVAADDTLHLEVQPAPSANASLADLEYVNSEPCRTCHGADYDSWADSAHFQTSLDNRGGPFRQVCQPCHGAAASHIADPNNTSGLFLFESASPSEVNARCLGCHASRTKHAIATDSSHASSGVSCIACHSPHHYQTKDFLLVSLQPELCLTCHFSQKHLFKMPYHHRVNEGIIRCTDCHNPHGSEQPKQPRAAATQDAVCLKCHRDEQGPFVYEHQPVKVDGCTACHVPHGGPNTHMLKVDTVNNLCLNCHTASLASAAPGAPSFHNQAALHQQTCTICHNRIHGSNSNSFFLK